MILSNEIPFKTHLSNFLGNNFYSLLTGYYPFFNVESDEEIQKKVAGHRTAAIDPRFYQICEEGRLAKIIGKMWEYYPDERPDIVDVRIMLRDAIVKCEKEEEEYQKKLAEEEALARKQAELRAEEEEVEKKRAQRRIEEQEELAKMEAADRAEAARKQQADAERVEAEKAAASAAAAEQENAKELQDGAMGKSKEEARRHPYTKRDEKQ